jgi:hypothetical protein
VNLHGEAESGTHFHLGETGFIRLWWILGAIFFCYFNCSGDKQYNNKRAPPMVFLMIGHFFFTQTVSFGGFLGFLFCFVLFFTEYNYHDNNTLSVYMSKKTRFLKKLKPPSLSIKGHI